ncbi:hypothetical protein [Lysinibacillus composti]|nr:hypothetical protein [Lysinibacillus composti]
MVLTFPFPNNSYADMTMSIFNIPIKIAGSINQVGVVSVVLLLFCMVCMVRALNSHQFIAVIIVIIAFSFIPRFVINLYQESFASGIYAISYDEKQTKCEFTRDEIDDAFLQGKCEVYFINHSNEQLTFEVTFHEVLYGADDYLMESLMNINGVHTISLAPKESRTFIIEETIDTTSIHNAIYSGTSYGVKVKIHANGNERVL